MEIRCAKVAPGMFPSEVYVEFDTGYEVVESLAPASLVNERQLSVRTVSETPEDFLVLIPGEILSGQRFTRIKKSHRGGAA
jgi:hypothetical protein